MSKTSERISTNSLYANSVNAVAVNSESITNSGAISTGTFTANDSAQVFGNLLVDGNVEFRGAIRAANSISFGDQSITGTDDGLAVDGFLTVTGGASFVKNTLIGTDFFGGIEEGLVTANNVRASNRLILGDSALLADAAERKITADVFTAYLRAVISDSVRAATAEIETGKITEARIDSGTFQKLYAEKLTAIELVVDSFTAASEFSTKDLVVDGSEIVSGGITINGAGRDEGALVVNGNTAVFNNGIKVYSRDGAITQTLTVLGTSDTTGTTDAERDENKFALKTSVGVRSLFQGDVVVQDSNVLLDNSSLVAEKLEITKLVGANADTNTLEFCKSGAGWSSWVDEYVTYESTRDASKREYVTAADIEARARQPFEFSTPGVGAAKRAKKTANAKAALKRSIARTDWARNFTVKDAGARYRIDADGNILAKNAIIEKIEASKIVTGDIVANSFATENLTTDNVSVSGTVAATEGISVSGSSQFDGSIYNYGEIQNKETASVKFVDRASAEFDNGTTIRINSGASLVTNDGADVALHGNVEIDMRGLVLFDSRTGKRYSFIIRDAEGEEGDEAGEPVIEFGELHSAGSVAETVGAGTRAARGLHEDLVKFQARLKRI